MIRLDLSHRERFLVANWIGLLVNAFKRSFFEIFSFIGKTKKTENVKVYRKSDFEKIDFYSLFIYKKKK